MDDPWANAWTTPAAAPSAPADDLWKPSAATWEPPAWPAEDDPMHAPPIWTAGQATEASDDDDDDEDEDEEQHDEEPVSLAPAPESEPDEEERPDTDRETETQAQAQALDDDDDDDDEHPSPTRPDDFDEHDAFGNFESAEPDIASPVAPDNAWAADGPERESVTAVSRSLWSPSEWKPEDGQDEWAAASTRQRLEEERERRFPREAVDALISQWDTLANDLWPLPETKPDEEQPVQRSESLPGLSDLLESLVPDYHLKPAPQFAKTALFKSLQTSLRLTKSYPMVQQSPLSQFYSSKGNSAWESAVKAQQVVKDDWPWETKLLESAPAAQSQAETKPAPARGILGLWSRRPTSMPPAPKGETTPRTASPAPRPSMDKPRPSIDSVRSSASKDTVATTAATSSPVATAPTSPTASLASPTSTDPAPSAISRLFGRFGRKATQQQQQPSEMTLSNSDLSFLGDVVPSTSGTRLLPEDDILGELSASSMAAAKLPAPPPLPPPPSLLSRPGADGKRQAQKQPQGWAFEDDDTDEDELVAMQSVVAGGAVLDAMLGDGLTGFAQGYAPVAAARSVASAARASSRLQQQPSHTAVLPSSLLAAERMHSPLPPPPPSAPRRTPVAPPPATLFGGDEFDDFMTLSSPPQPQARTPAQPQPFQSPSAAPLFASPSAAHTPSFQTPIMQATPTFPSPLAPAPSPVPAPGPVADSDALDDFGDFISLPAAPVQSIAPPLPPPVRRETRLPDPPRIGARTPVAVMSQSASTNSRSTGLPPALAPPRPPPGGRPVVVMSRAPAPSSSAAPLPLLAPPPGSSSRRQTVKLMEDANELLVDSAPASSPVSPVWTASRPASRSSLQPSLSLFDDLARPAASRSSSPGSASASPVSSLPPQMPGSLFDDLARPASRAAAAFSSVPLVSSPLAPTKSPPPPPRMTSPPFAAPSPPTASLLSSPPAAPANGDAFASLFGTTSTSSVASPPPPQKNGKLSAADLTFFDSL